VFLSGFRSLLSSVRVKELQGKYRNEVVWGVEHLSLGISGMIDSSRIQISLWIGDDNMRVGRFGTAGYRGKGGRE